MNPASSTAAQVPGQNGSGLGTSPAAAGQTEETPNPSANTIYTPNQVPGAQIAAQPPVESLILRTPQVTTLNANASSIGYADRHRGPFTLQTEVTGIYTSNLYNEFIDTTGVHSGGYVDFAYPVGFQHTSAETNFNVYFRGNTTVYPGNTKLNNSSEILAAEYVHNASEETTWDFSVAGGRIQSVEGYLPAVVAVGSTGVVQSNFTSGLQPMYNAATTLAVTHRVSEENTVIASATGAYMQQPYSNSTASTAAVLYRDRTAGLDLQLQHASGARRAYGVELTGLYVEGLSPRGHGNFITVEGTYQQALMRHWSLRLAGGPLLEQSQGAGAPSGSIFSYIASASLDYQTSYGHVAGGYDRILQLGYLAAASPANEYFVLFDRPISRTLDFTLDARKVQQSANGVETAGYGSTGLSARLSKHLSGKLVFFLGGAYFTQNETGASIGRNDASAGLTYSFGSVLSRTGDR